MRDLSKDPWIQILGVLALVSGLVALVRQLPGSAAVTAPPASTPPAASIAAPAPATGELAEPARFKNLRPRRPGKWVVDLDRSADADTDSIAEALHNAASGDQILIRPGRYRENLRIFKDVALIGEGDRAGEAVIDGGKGAALEVQDSEAVLRRLTFSSAELGTRVEGGFLTASDCRWEGGGSGLAAEGGASVKITGSVFSRLEEAVSASGAVARVELSGVKIQGGKTGLSVQAGAALKAELTELRDLRECALKASDKDSLLEVSASKVSGSGKGACLRDRARAAFKDLEFFDNAKGLWAEDGASVLVERSTFLRHADAAVALSGKSSLQMADSQLGKNKAAALSLAGASEARLERVKLEDNPEHPRHIKTVRSIGYKFEP